MISIESVTYRYANAQRDALCHVSLQIAEGSFVALTGANGSGKSTLARCLNGLLRPTSGRVLVDGMDTSDQTQLPSIRHRVGLLFQDPNHQITSPTIERELAFALQNLGTPPEDIHRLVDEQLQRLGLEHRRLDAPSSLSGGEKQRLILACLMMLHPRYLVLDEATSFLSPASRRRLMEDLVHLRNHQHTTLILITQFVDEIISADRVVVLQQGAIVFDGAPAAFAHNSSAFPASGAITPRKTLLYK